MLGAVSKAKERAMALTDCALDIAGAVANVASFAALGHAFAALTLDKKEDGPRAGTLYAQRGNVALLSAIVHRKLTLCATRDEASVGLAQRM